MKILHFVNKLMVFHVSIHSSPDVPCFIYVVELGLYSLPNGVGFEKSWKRNENQNMLLVKIIIMGLSFLVEKKLKAFSFEIVKEVCLVSHINVTQKFVFCSFPERISNLSI